MRQELVDAFNEIEHTDFKTLEEIKRLYSKADIVGAWLHTKELLDIRQRF